jgi:AraC family transcriptional regulator
MAMGEGPSFHIGTGTQPGFFSHIHWSDEPDVTLFDTGSLPVCAMRHHRTLTSGMVEIIADAPEAEDWDALIVNRSGSGTFGLDFCGSHKTLALHRDLCLFMPAGADSRMQLDGQAGSFALYFRPGLIASLLESEGKGADALAPIVGRHLPRVAHLLGLIEGELRRPSLGSRLMIDGLLRAIAGLLVSNDVVLAAGPAERIYLSPPKLRRVIDFIEANLQESIGLDDLARAAGLSANHFLRVFKLATGETPYHFLRARRLERARCMLTDNAMPLAELALECGFANQAHFTAAFSREVGISPGRYRRAARV